MTDQLTRSAPIDTPRPPVADPITRPPRRRAGWAFAAVLVFGAAGGTAGALAVSRAVAGGDDAPPPAVVDAPSRPPAALVRPATSALPPISASQIIQDEIDRALAERTLLVPADRPEPTAERIDPPSQRPAYLIIQDEIDRAIAERSGSVDGG